MERIEYMESTSKDGVTVGEHLAERDTILASEFMNLPNVKDGVVDGFHLIRGLGGIVRRALKFEYKTLNPGDNFKAHPKTVSQELAEWDDTDAARLGVEHLNEDVPAPEDQAPPAAKAAATGSQPKPPDIDIDDIPRIQFH